MHGDSEHSRCTGNWDFVCEPLVDSDECLCAYLTFPRLPRVGMGLVGLIFKCTRSVKAAVVPWLSEYECAESACGYAHVYVLHSRFFSTLRDLIYPTQFAVHSDANIDPGTPPCSTSEGVERRAIVINGTMSQNANCFRRTCRGLWIIIARPDALESSLVRRASRTHHLHEQISQKASNSSPDLLDTCIGNNLSYVSSRGHMPYRAAHAFAAASEQRSPYRLGARGVRFSYRRCRKDGPPHANHPIRCYEPCT
jgi:hypothetical protein